MFMYTIFSVALSNRPVLTCWQSIKLTMSRTHGPGILHRYCDDLDKTLRPYTSPYMRVRWGSLGPMLIRSIHAQARNRARKIYPRED
jgi:hypothetical protein